MTIYIMETDPAQNRPERLFLETLAIDVEVVPYKEIGKTLGMEANDIIFLDISQPSYLPLLTLMSFMETPPMPKILIAAFEGEIFLEDDTLKGLDVEFIFKPFLPTDLAAKIEMMQYAQ